MPDNLDAEPSSAGPGVGGDPACWLAGVCPDCGFYVDDASLGVCPRCGGVLPLDE